MRWFHHDLNAREDDKIFELIDRQGFQGYGFFWVVLEECYKSDEAGFQVEVTDTWRKRISKQFGVTDPRTITRLLDTLAEVGLISNQLWQEGVICVPGIQKRSDSYMKAKHLAAERKRKQRAKEKSTKAKAETKSVTRDTSVTSCEMADVTHMSRYVTPPDTDLIKKLDLDLSKEVKYSPVPSEPRNERASASKGGDFSGKDFFAKGEIDSDSLGESSDQRPVQSPPLASCSPEPVSARRQKPKKTKVPAFAYTAEFESWWELYRDFCRSVSTETKMVASGKKTEAFVSWQKLFPDGKPSQEFLEGDGFYRQAKFAEFQKKGELSDISHGCRYLGSLDDNPKWWQAYEFKVRKEGTPTQSCPLGQTAENRRDWQEFCDLAQRMGHTISLLTSPEVFLLDGRTFHYALVQSRLRDWKQELSARKSA